MDETILSKLMNRIDDIIFEKGLKKQSVAAKCGYTLQQFSSMLHGRKIITALDIAKIADVLEVTPNDLFGITGV